MISFRTTVSNASGIHARPAKVLVTEAKRFCSDIRIRANQKEANGKSIISVMTLCATKGTEVELSFSGDDEMDACRAIKDLFDNNLYE